MIKIQRLSLDPARSPGVLDTATWDPAGAWQAIRRADQRWRAVRDAISAGNDPPTVEGLTICRGTRVAYKRSLCLLLELSDGQRAFVAIGPERAAAQLGEPLGRLELEGDDSLIAWPADAATVDRFCRIVNPPNASRPLGPIPRLGIGVRMTTAVWPGIFDAMHRHAFAANAIQNSVRELNLLEDLLAAKPAARNYACGFGTIETGYTGSTFEGLWLSGVLAALAHDKPLRYGADADHVQVKRADQDLIIARRTLQASRYYSFYTFDLSDVLDYRAVNDAGWAEAQFATLVPDARQRRDLLAWHRQPVRRPGAIGPLPADRVVAFAAKYARAFDAADTLCSHLSQLKEGRPFDLELSIDEHPPEISAFDCLTSDDELVFVLRETQRRGLSVTHVAPNFGMEKGCDYRHPDGLEGLGRRVSAQHRIAGEFGVMLDVHSADDLTSPVRAVLRSATNGRLHYKVSPMLQLIFARVLQEHHPELFRRWWADARAYAQREADAGSPFARTCLSADGAAAQGKPSATHQVFHHYSFAFVGRRDADGRFMQRDEFYNLSSAFYQAYRQRIAAWLGGLAEELFA